MRGSRGAGYDYVLAGNGVFVQAENADLMVRVKLAECRGRGLEDAGEKLELRHGRIPHSLLTAGIFWFRETPDTERYFAVRWDGGKYAAHAPPQTGTSGSLEYQTLEGMLMEFHSHGLHPAFFSRTDDRDEQGFRIYGVAGRLDRPKPEIALRVGVYGHFGKIGLREVFKLGGE